MFSGRPTTNRWTPSRAATFSTSSVACFGVLPRAVTAVAGTGALGVALALAVPAFGAGAWLLRDRLALQAFTPSRRTS